MKKTLTFFLFLCFVTSAFAQKSFEGEVVYSLNIISNAPNISNKQAMTILGDTMYHYMKGANYKSVFNGKVGEWQLYINKDKKIYDKIASKDTISWHYVDVDHDTIYKSELKKNDTTILGYSCDKLTFTCNSGKQVYYFSKKFFIDPSLYQDFLEGNWYAYLNKAKAIALQEIIERKPFIFIITATAVRRKTLSDSIFVLPPGLPMVESKVKL